MEAVGEVVVEEATVAAAAGEVGVDEAFSRLEEEGVFNPQTGKAFRQAILARGGSLAPMELFKDFRGREPSIDALLRHSGLTEESAA